MRGGKRGQSIHGPERPSSSSLSSIAYSWLLSSRGVFNRSLAGLLGSSEGIKYIIHIAAIVPAMASVASLTPMILRPRDQDRVRLNPRVQRWKEGGCLKDESHPRRRRRARRWPGERRPAKGCEAIPPPWGIGFQRPRAAGSSSRPGARDTTRSDHTAL